MTRIKTVARSVHWLVAVLALALVCVPGAPLRADDKRDLISRIEDRLRNAASALAYLPTDSSDGPIDRARGYVDEARRYAEDLQKIAGDDSDARRLAESFRDVQDKWNQAAEHLRKLKAGMRQAEPIATSCTSRDQELVRKAREYESKNDPDGLTELPRQTATVQDAVKRELYDLQQHDSRMDDYADDADDFRGDGPWRDLASTVAQTAQTSFGLWRKSYESAKSSCANLERGVDHPTIKEILANLSNSAGGRKAIIEQLNKDARSLASTLAGVSEDSGLGSVQQAKALLQAIERGVESLGRTATSDKETRVILEKWPEGIRQLKEAIDDLEDLKVHQHDMDPLPERCQLKERELRAMIARNGDDADGIDEIPKFAETLAEPVRSGVAKADERMREEEGDRDRAKAISASEGPWRDVTAAEQRDADETFKTYEDGYKKTKDACADIVKGKDGAIVNAALRELQGKAATTGDALDRDVAAWVESARRTYILDCKKAEEMWQAFCGSDFEPGDNGDATAAVQTADRLQDEMEDAMSKVMGELKLLKPRVQALVDKRQTQARGKGLMAMIEKEEKRLTKLLDNKKAWGGNSSVALQYSNMYGNARHADEWRARGCQVPTSDTGYAVFEGGGYTKPDCIIARSGQCEIWEFKPDSPDGHSVGPRQASAYARNVPAYYNRLRRNKEAPDDKHGGPEFMAALMKYCYSKDDDEIQFRKSDVYYYKMCEKQYVCEE